MGPPQPLTPHPLYVNLATSHYCNGFRHASVDEIDRGEDFDTATLKSSNLPEWVYLRDEVGGFLASWVSASSVKRPEPY